jgi:hypothetical protein
MGSMNAASLPQDAITAAPGHILMFSITGMQTRLAAPLKHNGEPYPLELGGVSVSLVQNGRETAVPLFAVQQNTCPVPNCAVRTSITIQMPYELDTARRADAALVIRENGSTAGLIPVVPVRDSVHLIEDCDLVRTLVNASWPRPQRGMKTGLSRIILLVPGVNRRPEPVWCFDTRL